MESVERDDYGGSGEESYEYSEYTEESDEEPRAPTFMIPSRTIAAVEHPFQVVNVEKGLETFGPNPQYGSILNPNVPQLSVPIYLHPKDPTSRPTMSHYAASHNIVLKITVPKRTGRKRKRGTDGPWEGEVLETSEVHGSAPSAFRSQGKLDEARVVRRKLQDNIGRYRVNALGIIKHTHRYRGMVDFEYSMKNNDFMNKFSDAIFSRDVQKFRELKLQPGTDMTKNQAIIAPPLMTQLTLPSYYVYAQNPYVEAIDRADGTAEMVNTTAKVQSVGHFIRVIDKIPNGPSGRPNGVRDGLFDNVVKAIKMCMEERPVWTRRSIINRICNMQFDPAHPEKRIPTALSQQMVKIAIQYAGYQFKGGPWRDAVCRYGYDPRKDPDSRYYQTLIFRLRRLEIGLMGEQWQEIRKRDLGVRKYTVDSFRDSHLFDGKRYSEDGKVWQVCDLTDPVLAGLFATAAVRPECDIEGAGWFHRGLWAKARAIMKCKMRALQFGRKLVDSDFAEALAVRDTTPDEGNIKSIIVPTPDLHLTEKEWELVRGRRYKGVGRDRKGKKSATYHYPGTQVAKRLRKTMPKPDGASRQKDGEDDDAGEETVDESVMQTIEDEDGVGVTPRVRNVHFEIMNPSDDEDGSEYDEDETSEDEDGSDDDAVGVEGLIGTKDFDYGDDQNQYDLEQEVRSRKWGDYTDIEQGQDEDETEDEERSDEQDGSDEQEGFDEQEVYGEQEAYDEQEGFEEDGFSEGEEGSEEEEEDSQGEEGSDGQEMDLDEESGQSDADEQSDEDDGMEAEA